MSKERLAKSGNRQDSNANRRNDRLDAALLLDVAGAVDSHVRKVLISRRALVALLQGELAINRARSHTQMSGQALGNGIADLGLLRRIGLSIASDVNKRREMRIARRISAGVGDHQHDNDEAAIRTIGVRIRREILVHIVLRDSAVVDRADGAGSIADVRNSGPDTTLTSTEVRAKFAIVGQISRAARGGARFERANTAVRLLEAALA